MTPPGFRALNVSILEVAPGYAGRSTSAERFEAPHDDRSTIPNGVDLLARPDVEILSGEALALVTRLQRELGPRRAELLARRGERHAALLAGERPQFVERPGDWQVAETPPDLLDRRVEITGPVDRKMVINALNSGARIFMADFEDACSPTWANIVDGQRNVRDAVRGTISLETPEKAYRLSES